MQTWVYNPHQKIAPCIYVTEGHSRIQYALRSHRFVRDFCSDMGWLHIEITIPDQQVWGDVVDGVQRVAGTVLYGVQGRSLSHGIYLFKIKLRVQIDDSEETVKYHYFDG